MCTEITENQTQFEHFLQSFAPILLHQPLHKTLLPQTHKMKLSILSSLGLVALTSAMPAGGETTEVECVKPYLCCGSLTTPLDSTVDPILKTLGVNAANIVGSVGLACKLLLLVSFYLTCHSG